MQQLEANPRSNGETRTLIEDIHNYAGMVRRGWKLIVIGIAITLTLASIHLARSKTLYRASSRMLLIQQAGRPLNGASGGDAFRDLEGGYDSLATHLMLLRSPVIVERAISLGGLKETSAGAVIAGLVVKRPDQSAKVVELTYKAPSQDEARRVVDGVMQSYNAFLRDNFQKNTKDVIALIIKARDELSKELSSLEQQYLDYRQKNPAYSADDRGRSFIARRLDQWDQSMNQVLARSLQLRSQFELGKKLAVEGLDQDAITNALNQLGGLGGGTTVAPIAATGARPSGGQSIEKLREECAEVESQRLSAELLLAHLRREMAESASSAGVPERAIADAFFDDPEVARLQAERRQKQSKLQDILRLSRSSSDPAIVGVQKRLRELDAEIQHLWEDQRPMIVERLTSGSNVEVAAAVRKAEADLINLRAKKAALGEHLERLTSERLERLRKDREQLGLVQGADHPQVRQVERQIASLEQDAEGSPARRPGEEKNDALLGAIARSLEAIDAMRTDLQKKFDEDLDASKKAEIGQLGEANIRSNLDRQRALFNSVVDQLKQAQLVSDYGSVSAQTINPTEVAAEPPKYLTILAMALIAGCGLGTFGAYVVDLMDPRVRTVGEMRDLLNMPVLGLIPQMLSDQVGTTGRVGLLSHEVPRSALAESYKSTRTNLEFLRRNRQAQVLLVSSPQPGDGKSTTASNLAITLAHAGRRVLLIDGDLRKPSQHLIYNLAVARGFTDAIEGRGSIAQFARPTFVENLDLLSTGSDVSNPAELLASPRLVEVLDQARDAYDVVIIDSSPLMAVTDPSIIAAVADGVLLVVRVESSRRHDLERIKELCETMGLPVLGVVINGITRSRMNYGYGYGGYGYGYGHAAQSGSIIPPQPEGSMPAMQASTASHGLNGRIEYHTTSYDAG